MAQCYQHQPCPQRALYMWNYLKQSDNSFSATTEKPPLFITGNSNMRAVKCKYSSRAFIIFLTSFILFGSYSTTAIRDTLRISCLSKIYSNTPYCWHCRLSWKPPYPGSFKAFIAFLSLDVSLLLGSMGLERQMLLWSDTQLRQAPTDNFAPEV